MADEQKPAASAPKQEDPWAQMKDWVRREIQLAAEGKDVEERVKANP